MTLPPTSKSSGRTSRTSSRTPAPPEFVIDRSLGVVLAEAIRARGYVVSTLRSIYGEEGAQYIADEYWIPPAANKGQLILTKDESIRRLPEVEQIAYRTRAKLFCL